MMRTNVSTYYREGTTFSKFPSQILREFQEHVKNTGYPESYKHLHSFPADRNEPYEIIAKFSVESSKRGFRSIPCAMCSPRSGKFYTGMLVYFTNSGKVSLIGHECADDHNRLNANSVFEKKQGAEADQDFLLENYHNVPRMVTALELLLTAAIEAERLHRQFKKEATDVQNRLRKMGKDNDGRLVVEERLPTDKDIQSELALANRVSAFRTVTITTIEGEEATYSDFKHSVSLKNVILRLSSFEQLTDQNATLELLVNLSPVEQALRVAHIRSENKEFWKIKGKIENFSKFFTRNNFLKLN